MPGMWHSESFRQVRWSVALTAELSWGHLALGEEAPPSAAEAARADATITQQDGQPDGGKKLLDLDIDQLARTPVVMPSTPLSMDAPVTSVTREQSTLGHSAAAVFVITQEMIRRSGATSIPEVLRMAPGLEVAHINSNTWAITARGFNSRYADKLLVLIDGRTVYNPIFSGIYWDVQDVLLEDVERIEVVRGPGGTLWGANAVNGVISIITKKAKDTQGVYVTAGGGTQEKLTDGARIGGRLGENGYYRVYGKNFERGRGFLPDGRADDDWRQGRAGFRADWDLDAANADSVTVQGDYYVGDSGSVSKLVSTRPPFVQQLVGDDRVNGQNVLARWRHVHDEDSDWALQTYFDRYQREAPLRDETVTTFDVDFQYRFPLGERQKITCGAGFRNIHDDLPSHDDFTVHFDPVERTLNLASQFVQDEIALVEDQWTLTMGTKLEQNPYTGLEVQPSIRLLWTPDPRHSAWAAVSRAVRTPSRVDRDLVATGFMGPGRFARALGSDSFGSEALMAYEVGFREQATERFSWDLAAFYNVYDDLMTAVAGTWFTEFVPPPPHRVLPLVFSNGPGADTVGAELAGNWTLSERWRVYGYYTCFGMRSHRPAGFGEGIDPRHQVYLRSAWDLGRSVEFDLMARYVDALTAIQVPSYISMDLRLGWRPWKRLEVQVVGQNLLQPQHQEFGVITSNSSYTQVTYVPRGVYGTVTWRY